MNAIMLLSCALGFLVYGWLLSLPFFSPRHLMVGRLTRLPPVRTRKSAGARLLGVLMSRRRKAWLVRSYPDMLAHLATQTRVGASALQAFVSLPAVLREPLRGEVEELIADLRIAPLRAALERFAARCDIPEITAFAQSVIHQQALGIALPEILEHEEAHMLAIARQNLRRRIQSAAVTMAAVTVILLLNGVLICLTPLLYELSHLAGQG